MESTANKTIKGFAWKFFEKISYQVINLAIQIVLARILMPDDYGIIALLAIFMAIGDTFIKNGFTTAIIQKKNTDELDLSTVFWGNVVLSVTLYMILYTMAPSIAAFYKQPQLIDITRVLSLNLILGGVCAIHFALIAKRIDFKKSYIVNLINVLTMGLVGILLAIKGFGAWALVFSVLSGSFVSGAVLYQIVKWYPQFNFSFERLKSLSNYSSKVLVSNLLNTIFHNIHTLIIGRFFTNSSLAFYQRGQALPQSIMNSVDGSFAEVMYPTYSLIQDDLDRLRSAISKALRLSMFLCLPLMFCLCSMSENITIILLSEKWSDSIPFMQLSCIICSFWPLSTVSHAVNAIGRSGLTLKINILSKFSILFFIVICIPFGVFAIMVGCLVSSVVMLFISFYYYKRAIGYGLKNVISDIRLSFLNALVASSIVYAINFLDCNIYLETSLQLFSGVISYWLLSILTSNESYYVIISIVKQSSNRTNDLDYTHHNSMAFS